MQTPQVMGSGSQDCPFQMPATNKDMGLAILLLSRLQIEVFHEILLLMFNNSLEHSQKRAILTITVLIMRTCYIYSRTKKMHMAKWVYVEWRPELLYPLWTQHPLSTLMCSPIQKLPKSHCSKIFY